MIIENLRTSGVQNTIKKERLKFDRLEPFAGTWLHATGEYTERTAIRAGWPSCIGPEHGTVGPEQVKEAAKEAVAGVGFDLLIVCGFAFDPHVSEEAKRYGKLTVLPARMNPDLAMGDELLKKTGAGNLFMVFGEPDLEIKNRRTARSPSISRAWTSTTRPPARFAPTPPTTLPAGSSTPTTTTKPSSSATPTSLAPTSPTKSSSAPCAPRSTNPPGLRSIPPTAYPFEKPKTGKIAVKVINHYGDEVLKVYEVR